MSAVIFLPQHGNITRTARTSESSNNVTIVAHSHVSDTVLCSINVSISPLTESRAPLLACRSLGQAQNF